MIPRLDTMAVSFPVRPDFPTEGAAEWISQKGMPGETRRLRRLLPTGGCLSISHGHARVEASAKRGRGQNFPALLVPDAVESMREAVAEALEWCQPRDPSVPLEDYRLSRADLVCDFTEVHDVNDLLNGLHVVPGRRKGWINKRWCDPDRASAESLTVGPKSGRQKFTLYDKFKESGLVEAMNVIRFEARLNHEGLTGKLASRSGATMARLGDVSPDRVERLIRAYFGVVKFDWAVVDRSALWTLVFDGVKPGRCSERRQAEDLWAYLTGPPGRFDELVSKGTLSKLKARAARIRASTAAVGDSADRPTFSIRLDLDSGTAEVNERSA